MPLRMFVHNVAEPLQPLFLARSLLGRQLPLMNVNHGTWTSEHCGVFRLQHWETHVLLMAPQEEGDCVCGSLLCGFTCLWHKSLIYQEGAHLSPPTPSHFSPSFLSPSWFLHLRYSPSSPRYPFKWTQFPWQPKCVMITNNGYL